MNTTSTRSRLVRVASAACASALVLLSVLASPAQAHRAHDRGVRPHAFYLSLGDSNAFGLQFDRLFEMLDAGTYTPGAFNTGFTDVLAAKMQRFRSHQQTVNLSCPGETTETMINGGCFFTAPEPDGPGLTLHTDYEGSQLDAAVAFLRSHRHRVGPITLSIGGIDAAEVVADSCNFDAACVQQSDLKARLGGGLDHILGAIRAAAPHSQIILVAFYNPFMVEVPGTNQLWRRAYTSVQKDAARRNGARFVDASEIIRPGNVCRLTFMCGSGDSHPTDDGYRKIANQIFDAAGSRHLHRRHNHDHDHTTRP